MIRDASQSPLARRSYKIIRYQLVIGVLIAAGFFLLQGYWQALSALYGGLVTVIMTFLLGRRVERASATAEYDARRGMMLLFIGFGLRFLLVLLLFGVGFGYLQLASLAVIVGFGLTQAAYLIGIHEEIKG